MTDFEQKKEEQAENLRRWHQEACEQERELAEKIALTQVALASPSQSEAKLALEQQIRVLTEQRTEWQDRRDDLKRQVLQDAMVRGQMPKQEFDNEIKKLDRSYQLRRQRHGSRAMTNDHAG